MRRILFEFDLYGSMGVIHHLMVQVFGHFGFLLIEVSAITFMLVATIGIGSGFKSGMASAIGAAIGIVLILLLIVTGIYWYFPFFAFPDTPVLSYLFGARIYRDFLPVNLVGAVYLIYLAFQIWRAERENEKSIAVYTPRKAIKVGFLVSIANPNLGTEASRYATTVGHTPVPMDWELLVYAISSLSVVLVVMIAIGFTFGTLSDVLIRNAMARKIITTSLFIGLALIMPL